MDFWDKIILNYEEETEPLPIIRGITGNQPKFEELPKAAQTKTVAFVDGGNSTIFSAANFLYAKIRVGIAVFEGTKKILEKRNDYDLKCYYDGCWVADFGEIIKIDSKQITEDNKENIEKIPQMIRRILELRTVARIDADYIVLDGSLDYTFEGEEIKQLKANVLALSKTNSIRTTKGNSYTGILERIGPDSFVCKNVIEKVSFVKLQKSPYVFRIDGLLTDEFLYWIKEHAKDPAILGYPYGLIVADRIARIPEYEIKALRVKAFSELKGKSKVIRKILASKDIHNFLDGQNIY